MLIDVRINNNSNIPDDDLRSYVVSTLLYASMKGLEIPTVVTVNMVAGLLRRVIDGKVTLRSGELSVINGNMDSNRITVSYSDRMAHEILVSLIHELCHLIRICNKTNIESLDEEEIENAKMIRDWFPVVSCLSSVLIMNSSGELKDNFYGETKERDAGANQLVH